MSATSRGTLSPHFFTWALVPYNLVYFSSMKWELGVLCCLVQLFTIHSPFIITHWPGFLAFWQLRPLLLSVHLMSGVIQGSHLPDSSCSRSSSLLFLWAFQWVQLCCQGPASSNAHPEMFENIFIFWKYHIVPECPGPLLEVTCLLIFKITHCLLSSSLWWSTRLLGCKWSLVGSCFHHWAPEWLMLRILSFEAMGSYSFF